MKGALLAGSRSATLRRVVEAGSLPQRVVRRFVPGVSADSALAASEELLGSGRCVTLDYLGDATTDRAAVASTVQAYRLLLNGLAAAGLTEGARAEVSLKLSAIGQRIDHALARDNAATICAAASAAVTTVTIDMEDHTTTDSTLGVLRDLRQDFPATSAACSCFWPAAAIP